MEYSGFANVEKYTTDQDRNLLLLEEPQKMYRKLRADLSLLLRPVSAPVYNDLKANTF